MPAKGSLPEDFEDVIEYVRGLKREKERETRRKDPAWAMGVLERMEEFLDTLKEGTEEGDGKPARRGRRQADDDEGTGVIESIFGGGRR